MHELRTCGGEDGPARRSRLAHFLLSMVSSFPPHMRVVPHLRSPQPVPRQVLAVGVRTCNRRPVATGRAGAPVGSGLPLQLGTQSLPSTVVCRTRDVVAPGLSCGLGGIHGASMERPTPILGAQGRPCDYSLYDGRTNTTYAIPLPLSRPRGFWLVSTGAVVLKTPPPRAWCLRVARRVPASHLPFSLHLLLVWHPEFVKVSSKCGPRPPPRLFISFSMPCDRVHPWSFFEAAASRSCYRCITVLLPLHHGLATAASRSCYLGATSAFCPTTHQRSAGAAYPFSSHAPQPLLT